MPSVSALDHKKAAVQATTETLQNATAGVIVDYKGINVEDDTKLRAELRDAGVDYVVIKNSILRRASENVGFDSLKDSLVGSTALATSVEDPVAPARILAKFQKELKDHFTIKSGFVDGRVINLAEIKILSDLPSKEELIAAMLRSLNAPISGLAVVLNATMQGLVIALSGVAAKKAE